MDKSIHQYFHGNFPSFLNELFKKIQWYITDLCVFIFSQILVIMPVGNNENERIDDVSIDQIFSIQSLEKISSSLWRNNGVTKHLHRKFTICHWYVCISMHILKAKKTRH